MEQNLSYYYIFYITAKEKNISRAAKLLYISQPAVSKAIQKLEENIGATLFFRNSRGVQLTAEGKLLYEHVCNAFETLETAENQLKQLKTLHTGHIKIGVSTTLCKYVLLSYLKPFIQSYPHIKITIFSQSTKQTLEMLNKGELDLGLVGKPDFLHHTLTFNSVMEIQDTFVSTINYLSAQFLVSASPIQIFESGTILLLDKGNITRQYIDNYFLTYQIYPNYILETSTMDLLIEFAKIGLGVACVIKNFIKEELESKKLIEILLPNPIPPREIGFVYRNQNNISYAMEQFLSEIRQSQ